MPVSEKMIEALSDHAEFEIEGVAFENPKEVAQAVINTAWPEFSFDDQTTWPKTSIQKKNYYVHGADELTRYWFSNIPIVTADLWRAAGVTHYADPDHFEILNVQTEKNHE